MSDLQCAATLLLALDAVPARLPEVLNGRAVAAVYTAPEDPSRTAASVAADRLGSTSHVLDGLAAPAPGEAEEAVSRRFTRAAEEVADLHRGETVLVVTHTTAAEPALGRLARTGRPESLLELLVDADGWAVSRL